MATSIHNNSSPRKHFCGLLLSSKVHNAFWILPVEEIACFRGTAEGPFLIPQNPGLLSFFTCSKCYWTAQIFFFLPSAKRIFLGRVWCTIVVEDFAFPCDSGNDTLWRSCSPCSQLLTQIILQRPANANRTTWARLHEHGSSTSAAGLLGCTTGTDGAPSKVGWVHHTSKVIPHHQAQGKGAFLPHFATFDWMGKKTGWY